MKRGFFVTIIALTFLFITSSFFILVGVTSACAMAGDSQDKASGSRARPRKPMTRAEKRKANMIEASLSAARNTLSKEPWIISLTSSDIVDPSLLSDTLNFAGGKIVSENLAEMGYAKSNYALNLREDGVAVWETMQANSLGDRAFLRGELSDNVMKGVISIRPKDDDAITLYFTATR